MLININRHDINNTIFIHIFLLQQLHININIEIASNIIEPNPTNIPSRKLSQSSSSYLLVIKYNIDSIPALELKNNKNVPIPNNILTLFYYYRY